MSFVFEFARVDSLVRSCNLMYTRKFAKTSSLKGKSVIDRNALQSGHRNQGSAIFTKSKVNRSMQRFSCSHLLRSSVLF
jgi:hypothetical protein